MAAVDPRLMGGPELEPVNVPQFDVPERPQFSAAQAANVLGTVAGPDQAAGAAIQAEEARPKATFLESFGAGITQWDTLTYLDKFTRPDFKRDEPGTFDAQTFVNNLDIQMTSDERNWLLASAHSQEEMQYKVERLRRVKQAQEAIGDNMVAGLLAGAADPLYLGIDLGAMKIARIAKLAGKTGKNVSAGLAGVGAAAAGAGIQDETNQALFEIMLMSGVQAAGVRMAYNFKSGKMEPADPNFPAKELQDVVDSAGTAPPRWEPVLDADGNTVIGANGKPKYRLVKPVQQMPETAPAAAIKSEDALVAKTTAPTRVPAEAAPEPVPGPVPEPAPTPLSPEVSERVAEIKARNQKLRDILNAQIARGFEVESAKKQLKGLAMREAADIRQVTGKLTAKEAAAKTKRDNTIRVGSVVRVGDEEVEVIGLPFGKLKVKSGGVERTISREGATLVRQTLPSPARGKGVSGWGETARARLSSLIDDVSIGPVASALLERAGATLDNIPVQVRKAADMPKGNPGYFDLKTRTIVLADDAPATVVTHEVAHALTVDKIEYGLANPQSAHGAIVNELRSIMNRARFETAQMEKVDFDTDYFTGDIHEFVAGLYSGDSQFVRVLASMPDKSTGTSLLGSLVNAVRKLLGLDPEATSALTRALKLTEDLLDAPEVPQVRSVGMLGAPRGDVAEHVEKQMSKWSAKNLGSAIAWNYSKSLQALTSGDGLKFAKDLLTDPLNTASETVEDIMRAVKGQLQTEQFKVEQAVLAEMRERGISFWDRVNPFNRKAMEVQQGIMAEIQEVLADQERRFILGQPPRDYPVSPNIKAAVKAHNDLMRQARREAKSAGVFGAEDLQDFDGYFHRSWDHAATMGRIEHMKKVDGLTDEQAKTRIYSLVISSIRRFNPDMSDEVSHDVGRAIVNRMFRKGEGKDTEFVSNWGKMTTAEIKDILISDGVSPQRIAQALKVLTGSVEEGGKAPMLKHRILMDPKASILHKDGSTTRVIDLWDSNILRANEQYVDTISSQIGFARKGYKTVADIQKGRDAFLEGTKLGPERAEAVRLIDGAINILQGRPVGEDVGRIWRIGQGVGRAVTLGYSGLWQVTEYSTLMQRYGIGTVMRHAFKQMPGMRPMYDALGKDRALATSVTQILARNSSQEVRLRPYITRYADNYEVSATDTAQLALQPIEQLVPVINGMKYVMHHQAQIAANAITDLLQKAVKGDAAAADFFEQYGLKRHLLDQMRDDLTHTLNTDEWSEGTWEAVRVPLMKIMDQDVLRARAGEVPAWAQLTSLGKFLAAYRNFVFAAQNKILANRLQQDGYLGIATLAVYQYPLTVLATLAANTLQGKEPMEPEELMMRAFGQMGMIGLGSELFGIASGESNRINLPGIIVYDRAAGAIGAAFSGDAGKAFEKVRDLTPLLSIVPGIKPLTNLSDE